MTCAGVPWYNGGMTIVEPAPDELVKWLDRQRGEAADAIRRLAAAWPPPQYADAHARVIEALVDYHDEMQAAIDALGGIVLSQSPKTARVGSTRWVIRRYFDEHPGPATVRAILNWIEEAGVEWTAVTDSPSTAMAASLGHLKDEGELERLGRGVYRPVPVPPGTGQ